MTPTLKAYVIASLRHTFLKSYQRNNALAAARVKRGVYLCNICKKEFGRSEIQVDHVTEIMTVCQPFTFDCFIEQLFEGALQVLCKACHKVKTSTFRAER